VRVCRAHRARRQHHRSVNLDGGRVAAPPAQVWWASLWRPEPASRDVRDRSASPVVAAVSVVSWPPAPAVGFRARVPTRSPVPRPVQARARAALARQAAAPPVRSPVPWRNQPPLRRKCKSQIPKPKSQNPNACEILATDRPALAWDVGFGIWDLGFAFSSLVRPRE
jgi:hypothetical protein